MFPFINITPHEYRQSMSFVVHHVDSALLSTILTQRLWLACVTLVEQNSMNESLDVISTLDTEKVVSSDEGKVADK